MMSGRPTMVKNLVPGVTCRIRVGLGHSQDGWVGYDDTGIGAIFLTGRTGGLGDIDPYVAVYLIGHRNKNPRDNSFVIEEIDE